MSRPQPLVTKTQPPTTKLSSPSKQGPPLDLEYYSVSLSDGIKRIGRSAGGAINRTMERQDLLKDDGWHDWGLYDFKSKRQTTLKDSRGQTTVAPVGQTKWQGMGPNIPANSNCLNCHTIARIHSDVSLLPQYGPVEAFAVQQLSRPQVTKPGNKSAAQQYQTLSQEDKHEIERRTKELNDFIHTKLLQNSSQ